MTFITPASPANIVRRQALYRELEDSLKALAGGETKFLDQIDLLQLPPPQILLAHLVNASEPAISLSRRERNPP